MSLTRRVPDGSAGRSDGFALHPPAMARVHLAPTLILDLKNILMAAAHYIQRCLRHSSMVRKREIAARFGGGQI